MSNRPENDRGCYRDAHVQARYLAALDDLSVSGPSEEDAILMAYYGYLCKRRLRIVHLSGAHGLEGIRAYAGDMARALSDLLAWQGNREGAPPLSRARAAASLDSRYVEADRSEGFILGRAGRSTLGAGSALGTSTMEVTARVNLCIQLRLAEWDLFMNSAIALPALVSACDSAVPVGVDFRIDFAVDPEDWTFVLPRGAEAGKRTENPVFLGVNSGIDS